MADLSFVKGGGRTVLSRQTVPYPFHITRPFALDRTLPDLQTLYLQSASGGIYQGDRLALDLTAGSGARVHLTSQAATVVHRTPAAPASLTTRVTVGTGAFLALTNDPFILFPEADFATRTTLQVAEGGCAILADGYAVHDPQGGDRPFTRLDIDVRVLGASGERLVSDRGWIDGVAFSGPRSPLGPYRAMGSMTVIGRTAADLAPATIAQALDGLGCCAGASALPNVRGMTIRCLAADGGQLARGLDRLFVLAFEALLGCRPAPRPK